MPWYETHCLTGKGQTRRTHDIAFGAANVSQHGIAEIEPGQLSQQLLHGQDRHCQLNDIRP